MNFLEKPTINIDVEYYEELVRKATIHDLLLDLLKVEEGKNNESI